MNSLGLNAIAAIAGIVILAAIALALGYDGLLFLTAVGVISGLGGYPVLKQIHKAYTGIGESIGEEAERKGIL